MAWPAGKKWRHERWFSVGWGPAVTEQQCWRFVFECFSWWRFHRPWAWCFFLCPHWECGRGWCEDEFVFVHWYYCEPSGAVLKWVNWQKLTKARNIPRRLPNKESYDDGFSFVGFGIILRRCDVLLFLWWLKKRYFDRAVCPNDKIPVKRCFWKSIESDNGNSTTAAEWGWNNGKTVLNVKNKCITI